MAYEGGEIDFLGIRGRHRGQAGPVFRFQQLRGLGGQRRAAGQGRVCMGPALAQQRHHVAAQVGAIVFGGCIAGIVHPAQIPRPGPGVQILLRIFQQRAPQPAGADPAPGRHGPQALHARAPQGAQQEGFRLVIAVVGEGKQFAFAKGGFKGPVTGLAGGGFQAQPRVVRHRDPGDGEGNIQRGTDGLAVCGPVVGLGLQAVVHVDRAQAAGADCGVVRKQVQQHAGVQTAAEAHQHRSGKGR